MKCPHCGYTDGWDAETMESVKGVDGEFYTLPVELVQYDCKYDSHKSRTLCGCPKCSKVFMG